MGGMETPFGVSLSSFLLLFLEFVEDTLQIVAQTLDGGNGNNFSSDQRRI